MGLNIWTTEPSSVYVWTSSVKEVYVWTTKVWPTVQPVSVTFSYTGSDQTWTVPYTQDYIITAKWAWSNTSAWGLWQGTINLTAGTILKIMVGQSWSSTSSGTYWFGWTSNYSSNRSWWWLSWVFTWSEAITATSASRALVIGWWAWWWQSSSRAWWMWGWETWQNWQWSNYWTAWGWGTQTGRNSWWNVWANQFNGWNGSWTYWWWGWWWWYGWNWSIWDWSWDDDKWAGWGSGYIISTASNRVLTQWGWSASWNHWSVTIVSV